MQYYTESVGYFSFHFISDPAGSGMIISDPDSNKFQIRPDPDPQHCYKHLSWSKLRYLYLPFFRAFSVLSFAFPNILPCRRPTVPIYLYPLINLWITIKQRRYLEDISNPKQIVEAGGNSRDQPAFRQLYSQAKIFF
jgi:hypothetical protein